MVICDNSIIPQNLISTNQDYSLMILPNNSASISIIEYSFEIVHDIKWLKDVLKRYSFSIWSRSLVMFSSPLD
jgi:hypothetical protein